MAGATSNACPREFASLGTKAVVVTTDPAAIGRAEIILRSELEAIDLACSRFREDSEISRVSRGGGRKVEISPLLTEAMQVALEVAEVTNGAVDPTVGSAIASLGYDRVFPLVPAHGLPLRDGPTPVPGWQCIELDVRARLLRTPAGVALDLGASAKAFVADRAAALIAEATGTGVLVNLGGDIALAGPPPADGWAVGLSPDSASTPQEAGVVIAIRHGGLASSGTSVRTWRRGARSVHHIVDPATGLSAASCWSLVTVAATTCVAANAASTAAIVWGAGAPERLSAFGLPCRLVHEDGPVLLLGGWPVDKVREPMLDPDDQRAG
jgi:thiamine biosynthesis lipoprotein